MPAEDGRELRLLVQTIRLVRPAAIEVAVDLSYSYPEELDRRVTGMSLPCAP